MTVRPFPFTHDEESAVTTPSSRQPICFHCGNLHTRWFQPLIGTENFCSIACAQSYVGRHKFDGQARAIHTAACKHFTPDGQAEK